MIWTQGGADFGSCSCLDNTLGLLGGFSSSAWRRANKWTPALSLSLGHIWKRHGVLALTHQAAVSQWVWEQRWLQRWLWQLQLAAFQRHHDRHCCGGGGFSHKVLSLNLWFLPSISIGQVGLLLCNEPNINLSLIHYKWVNWPEPLTTQFESKNELRGRWALWASLEVGWTGGHVLAHARLVVDSLRKYRGKILLLSTLILGTIIKRFTILEL